MNAQTALELFLRRYWRETALFIVVGFVVGPLVYHGVPAYAATADVLYMKGKILQVLHGSIYADPVTGIDTMHPPVYHLLLAPFAAAGLELDTILILIAIVNVALMTFLTYRVTRQAFDPNVGLLTAMMLPFIIEFMGSRNLLLATAFNFSVPIYLAGLWLYLVSADSLPKTAVAALLWGLAFIISPVYLFIIGLTSIYEAAVHRNYRRLMVMIGTLALAVSPFVFQAVYIYSKGLWGAGAFAFWRGIPDIGQMDTFAGNFLAPIRDDKINFGTAIHAIILFVAAYTIIRRRRVHWFIPISLLAYLLTSYHYNPQYATRIQLLLSIFIVATAIHGLRSLVKNKTLWSSIVLLGVMFGVYRQVADEIHVFEVERNTYTRYIMAARPLWRAIETNLEEDEYVFCNKRIYRYFILPRFRMHALGAYTTMDYFQLQSGLADELERDFQTAWASRDYAIVDGIARKYNIGFAIFGRDDRQAPVFPTLMSNWSTVFDNQIFVILKRPE